ncbi:hypothetical protein C9374_014188 [Naegleria lovaniensis]|uniref:BTB domain-containing protein n=1 Tax=Naegleria lovaniensis TaxID=51637 RepID=A0AA88H049_NAELO|nr:uncharacterized protein C9374_014188 [Naegleria lovaniensis]KAG2389628.1 hypothetical protein C9374_014188 [Naegleria lovaniensis]
MTPSLTTENYEEDTGKMEIGSMQSFSSSHRMRSEVYKTTEKGPKITFKRSEVNIHNASSSSSCSSSSSNSSSSSSGSSRASNYEPQSKKNSKYIGTCSPEQEDPNEHLILNEPLSPSSKGLIKTIMKSTVNGGIEIKRLDTIKEPFTTPRSGACGDGILSPKSAQEQIPLSPIEPKKQDTVKDVSSESQSKPRNQQSAVKVEEKEFTTQQNVVPQTPEKEKRKIQVVKLNVGGKLFQTTSKTLKKSEILYYLYRSANSQKKKENSIEAVTDENGVIFIDRDPKYFIHVLNYLRDGMLVGCIEDLSHGMIEHIIHEASYFKIFGLINDIEEQQIRNVKFDQATLEDCQLRHYNQEVVKRSESGSLYSCLDYVMNKKRISLCNNPYRYYTKFVLRYGDSSNLALGVTCKQADKWKRFEILKKIKEKDTIAIWYNYEAEQLVLYWNDVQVQRKTFKIDSNDWVFHVEMFADDNYCGLKIVQTTHPQLSTTPEETNVK